MNDSELQEARRRVLDHVMREIHHIPLPQPKTYGQRVLAVLAGMYLVLALAMVYYHALVGSFWRWMIATAWVDALVWAFEHPWGFADVLAAGAAIMAVAVMVRTRGGLRG